MSSQPPSSIELEFAKRYDQEHARVCQETRPTGWARRLSLWRDEQLVRRALKEAGEPGLILDVACGAGRFWPVLAEHANRVILATDNSQDMLNHAQTHHSAGLLKRVKTFQGSAFTIGLSANAVDCIFCMRLFQHVVSSEHRLVLLREFHRVSRDTVIVSVQVDSGFNVRRHEGLDIDQETSTGVARHQRVSKAQVEGEFRQAGFEILDSRDFMPGCALSRVYVLRKLS
jgi:SAM-dependent methyltransferase